MQTFKHLEIVKAEPNYIVFILEDELDGRHLRSLKEDLAGVAVILQQRSEKRVFLDCSRVQYVHASLLEAFEHFHHLLCARGFKLLLRDMNDNDFELFAKSRKVRFSRELKLPTHA